MLNIECRTLRCRVDAATRIFILDRLQEQGLAPIIRSARTRAYELSMQGADSLKGLEQFIARTAEAEGHSPYIAGDLFCFENFALFLIFDEEGRKLGPIGIPIVNDERYEASWSADNLAEIERGWVKKGNSLEDGAAQIDVNPKILRATVERWNELCREGRDEDHKRPPKTMMPIVQPPFYVVEAWPTVNNTQGGPELDVEQRVLDPMKRPIPRLYVAGEISSIYGHLYLEAGNITECFVAGKIAGQNAAREQDLP